MEGVRDVESRNLYSLIAAAALLLVGVLAWVSQDPVDGMPYWGYAAAGLGFLLLAYAVWASRVEIQGGIRLRSTRTGIQVAAMVVIVAGILVVVELFSVNHYTRWDLTPGKFFSLSPKTLQILDKLDKEKRRIEFIAFTRKIEQSAVEEILQQYAHRTKQVTYRFVDLDASPRTAKRYDVDAYGTVVVVHHFEADAEKKEGAKPEAAAKEGQEKEKKTFRSEKIYDLSENAIANAILKAVQTEQKRVYFLTGHGERPHAGAGREVLSSLATGMRDDNYRVEELLLLREKGVPKEANLLVIADPKKDLEEPEVQFLEAFLKRGGRLLVFLEPESSRGRLTGLLERFGFEIPASFVIDPQSVRFALAGGNEVTPFAADYGVHKITEQLRGLATVFPTARKVAVKGDPKRGISAEVLVRTGPGSFTVDRILLQDGQLTYNPRERKDGPVPLAAAVVVSLDAYLAEEQKKAGKEAEKKDSPSAAKKEGEAADEARIVVFGDADVASDAYIGAQGNANLVFNAVNWLSGERELISILPKRRIGEPLFLGEGQGTFVRLLTVWVIPLFVVLAGAAVYVRRRQLR